MGAGGRGEDMTKRGQFRAEQFTPTQWATAEDKAMFANHFVRFAQAGFPRTLFYKWFYARLSRTFGHIAHYDQGGFYATWFDSTQDKLEFLKRTVEHGDHPYGDPVFTYSDVERVIARWVIEEGLIKTYADRLAQEVEAEERAMLAKLQNKYQTGGERG